MPAGYTHKVRRIDAASSTSELVYHIIRADLVVKKRFAATGYLKGVTNEVGNRLDNEPNQACD